MIYSENNQAQAQIRNRSENKTRLESSRFKQHSILLKNKKLVNSGEDERAKRIWWMKVKNGEVTASFGSRLSKP